MIAATTRSSILRGLERETGANEAGFGGALYQKCWE